MHPAAAPIDELLAACEIQRTRRSGPGGQHRNKVETAVVITHRPSGVRGEAGERRSQEQNRRQAVFRLRVNLALALRSTPAPLPSPLWQTRCRRQRIAINPQHDDFPALLSEAMDVLQASEMDLAAAADQLACTPSQLVKLLRLEPRALQWVNHRRAELGLHALA